MKKVSAFILSVLMVISCLAVASFAEDEKTEALAPSGKCGENVSWSFDSETGTLVLSGKGATDSYSSVIGDFTSVEDISPFYKNSDIKKVVVEDGITTIGSALFYSCENLAEIVIPDSVVSIGGDILLDTAIYKDADNWDGEVLYCGNSIIAADKDIQGEYKIKDNTKLIADDAFSGCTGLTAVKFNSDIKYLGFDAFANTGLETVTVPASLVNEETNGAKAFMGSTLKSAVFEDGAKFVPASAFAGCAQLKTVTLPDSIEKIGEYAFFDCNSLEEFTVPAKVTELVGTFSLCKSLKTLNIPVSVKSIGMFALSESIKTINYAGTKAQWNKIDINSTNKKAVDGAVINFLGEVTPEVKNGLIKTESGWKYFKDDKVDMTFNGLAKNAYGWWYISNGTIDYSYQGLAKNEYGWWYVSNGKIDYNYVGLAKNAYGWWYVSNGKIDYKYVGLGKNQYGWWYVSNGKIDYKYVGLAKNQYGWWYVSNGKIDYNFKGLAKNAYGWWYVKNGTIDFTYNGTARNPYGRWNVVNGKVTTKA